MAYAHVETLVYSGGASGGTSGAGDFTGCDLLIAAVADYSSAAPAALSDSEGNTWTALTTYSLSNAQTITLYWVVNPDVSAAQTFTITGTFSSVIVNGFSGAHASPYDGVNGATNDGSASTIATGALTPSEDNCLLIYAGVPYLADVSSVNVGTLAGNYAGSGGVSFGTGVGFEIQTTATLRNPTFTFSASTAKQVATIASFKAAAGGGGGGDSILRPPMVRFQPVVAQ